MKTYFIDGNNLIERSKRLQKVTFKSKNKEREQLAIILERFFEGKKVKVILFVDGFAEEKIRTNKIKMIYSENRKADELIKENIEKEKNPRLVTVVSSDLEIIRFAKTCCCDYELSEDFAKKVFKPKLNEDEKERVADLNTADFLKLFGVGENE